MQYPSIEIDCRYFREVNKDFFQIARIIYPFSWLFNKTDLTSKGKPDVVTDEFKNLVPTVKRKIKLWFTRMILLHFGQYTNTNNKNVIQCSSKILQQ